MVKEEGGICELGTNQRVNEPTNPAYASLRRAGNETTNPAYALRRKLRRAGNESIFVGSHDSSCKIEDHSCNGKCGGDDGAGASEDDAGEEDRKTESQQSEPKLTSSSSGHDMIANVRSHFLFARVLCLPNRFDLIVM